MRPESAGSRGPIGRQPKLSPTGYRVSSRRREELLMAGRFVSRASLQDIIDYAVTDFLDRLRDDAPEFDETLKLVEQYQQRKAGVRSVGEADASKSRKP